jgi:hypothetical protein
MQSIGVLAAIFFLLVNVNALHFYLNTGETRCFFEELPLNTLVVGRIDAFEYNQQLGMYLKNPNLNVEFTVDVSIASEERELRSIVSQLADNSEN